MGENMTNIKWIRNMKVSGCHLPEQFVWVLYKGALETSGSFEKEHRNKEDRKSKGKKKNQLPPKFLLADNIFTDSLSEYGTSKAVEEII